MPQWFMSLQAVRAAVRGGYMENATTRLDKIMGSIRKRGEKIKKRWGNQHKIRLEPWKVDAVV